MNLCQMICKRRVSTTVRSPDGSHVAKSLGAVMNGKVKVPPEVKIKKEKQIGPVCAMPAEYTNFSIAYHTSC